MRTLCDAEAHSRVERFFLQGTFQLGSVSNWQLATIHARPIAPGGEHSFAASQLNSRNPGAPHQVARLTSTVAKSPSSHYRDEMTPEAEFLSSERQALIDAYEQVDRSAVCFSMDYASGMCSGMHRHPKAQLIYAISGVMRVETEGAYFVLPPTKALFLPPAC